MQVTGMTFFSDAERVTKALTDHYWQTQSPRSAQIADALHRLLTGENIEECHVDAVESLWKEQQDPMNENQRELF